MRMRDRLYGLRPAAGLPVEIQEFGHIQKIGGILFQGEGKDILLVLPDGDDRFPGDVFIYKPDEAEWGAVLSFCDDPHYYGMFEKIWIRKAQRMISSKVQQMIWARDDFACVYCGKKMGEVQLTIDHFVPLELGGVDNEQNYLSACARCNNEKGKMSPEEWCKKKNLDYKFLVEYLSNS